MTDIQDKIALQPIQRVEIVSSEEEITLSGDVVLDTFGALDDASETNPDAASATMASLLRGTVEKVTDTEAAVAALEGKVDDLIALVGTASDDENDVTLIGLLTRIAIAVEAP